MTLNDYLKKRDYFEVDAFILMTTLFGLVNATVRWRIPLHCGERSYPMRMTLSGMVTQLDPQLFQRVRRPVHLCGGGSY